MSVERSSSNHVSLLSATHSKNRFLYSALECFPNKGLAATLDVLGLGFCYRRHSVRIYPQDPWPLDSLNSRLTGLLATCFVHIVAIIMTAIMILHIRSKYTAVGESIQNLATLSALMMHPLGRKEIVMFFWMYALIELLAMFLDSGVIPTSNEAYSVRSVPLILGCDLDRLTQILVVCCSIHRTRSCGVLLSFDQWFRRLPVC